MYVGPPSEYPDLTTSQVKLLVRIQEILAKSGIPPLTILYGGRRSHSYGGINFVAVNANSTFAWRKYDPSPGAGANWVYFSGAAEFEYDSFTSKKLRKKPTAFMKTSEFVAAPGKYLPSYKK